MTMMHLRKLLLKSQGTRLLLAAVFCALFLNGVEFIVHNHAAEQQTLGQQALNQPAGQHTAPQQGGSAPHADQCGYCATFNGLSSASSEPVVPRFAVSIALLVLVSVVTSPVLRRPFTVAQPRGPPRS